MKLLACDLLTNSIRIQFRLEWVIFDIWKYFYNNIEKENEKKYRSNLLLKYINHTCTAHAYNSYNGT